MDVTFFPSSTAAQITCVPVPAAVPTPFFPLLASPGTLLNQKIGIL